jgi:hypothetical protein
VLLGIPDDNADGLPMLEITGLAADDARDGGRLSDDVPAELPTLTGEDCPELAVEGTLETPLGGDDPLGSDDAPEPLERLADDSDDSVPELSEPIDFVLCDDGWFDNDDGSDDCPDEPPLQESEDREPELPEGNDGLSEPLEPDDDRSDDPDELPSELLGSELLGQLEEERPDEPLLDSDLPLNSELRELPSELSSDELRSELEPLLPEDSLDELGEDRDDSLTLENDLLDP